MAANEFVIAPTESDYDRNYAVLRGMVNDPLWAITYAGTILLYDMDGKVMAKGRVTEVSRPDLEWVLKLGAK